MAFHSVFGLTILGTVYGIWEARRVNVRKVEISSQKIGDRKKALRLVQISDLHLGDSSTLRRTRKMVDAINRLEPDLIVSTGDLFDGFLSQMGPYVAVLNELKAPLGKFAVSGNHEVYAGLEEAVELTRQVGFCVLRDEAIEASEGLRVVGVEDPAAPNRKSEAEAMGDGGERVFTLLLKHRPEVDKSSLGKFDLQLSGHTHGGQIFPFHYLTKLRYSVRPGLTDLGDSRFLYLSRGTGTWGPQIRYFAPPEVTYLVVGS